MKLVHLLLSITQKGETIIPIRIWCCYLLIKNSNSYTLKLRRIWCYKLDRSQLCLYMCWHMRSDLIICCMLWCPEMTWMYIQASHGYHRDMGFTFKNELDKMDMLSILKYPSTQAASAATKCSIHIIFKADWRTLSSRCQKFIWLIFPSFPVITLKDYWIGSYKQYYFRLQPPCSRELQMDGPDLVYMFNTCRIWLFDIKFGHLFDTGSFPSSRLQAYSSKVVQSSQDKIIDSRPKHTICPFRTHPSIPPCSLEGHMEYSTAKSLKSSPKWTNKMTSDQTKSYF